MRHRITGWLFVAPVLAGPSLLAQVSLHIGPASTLEVTGSIDLELSGNWINQGMFNPGSGTVTFNGASGTQTISGPGGEIFHNLVVHKTADGVQLLSPVAVNGGLILSNGTLDLNGNNVTLGPAAALAESEGNVIFSSSSGAVTATRTLNAPSDDQVAGIGVVITSGANLGSTTIARQHTAFSSGSNTGIKRSYTITPTNNSGLNATLMFLYDDSELNGLVEDDLVLFHSADNGVTWTNLGGGVDIDHNSITVSGVNSLSTFTAAASSNPLPVQLVELTVTAERSNAALKWKTETETDNLGFEIERRKIADEKETQPGQSSAWAKVGFVKGSGTSASPRDYTFIDRVTLSGRYGYRLKQVNQDGTFSYTETVEAVVSSPEAFALHRNYPNPFNPSTTIEYELPEELPVRLVVYDNLGREVKILVDGIQQPGYYRAIFDAVGYASGLYYCRLETKEQTHVARMLLMK